MSNLNLSFVQEYIKHSIMTNKESINVKTVLELIKDISDEVNWIIGDGYLKNIESKSPYLFEKWIFNLALGERKFKEDDKGLIEEFTKFNVRDGFSIMDALNFFNSLKEYNELVNKLFNSGVINEEERELKPESLIKILINRTKALNSIWLSTDNSIDSENLSNPVFKEYINQLQNVNSKFNDLTEIGNSNNVEMVYKSKLEKLRDLIYSVYSASKAELKDYFGDIEELILELVLDQLKIDIGDYLISGKSEAFDSIIYSEYMSGDEFSINTIRNHFTSKAMGALIDYKKLKKDKLGEKNDSDL